jgi:hypothetical protein
LKVIRPIRFMRLESVMIFRLIALVPHGSFPSANQNLVNI